MGRLDVSLDDKFDISKHQVLLNGTQALVRLMIAQRARDETKGWNTAGYVTGYRGSPLGAVDFQMKRAAQALDAANITFQEGLNEDLAATALWGAQQAELRGEGLYDGVFGLWYGKGPGVDRSGDVMRHVNMAGTSAKGGVIMAMGDDHTGESSTTLHQSEWAMMDAHMPIVSPAGVQEILDYGHYGYELSRFSGLWVGLKTMKDTVEVTSVVDGNPHRLAFITPSVEMPDEGLNIRLIDTPTEQEERLLTYKVAAAEAFSRANKMDKRLLGQTGAKIGFVAAGKNWLDLIHAFSLLNIDEAEAERRGITAYKVGQTWPLDQRSLREWADGLDVIIVVEEKRKLIEPQIKEALFDDLQGRRVYGARHGLTGAQLFTGVGALDPVEIAEKLGQILREEGAASSEVLAGMAQLEAAKRADNASETAARIPYFCAGCPHNSSTKLPEGARAYAGIGCHYMAQWMDRETLGYTHMGGEGANWIGESAFSTRKHVFQNIGDGTYNHSGIQAIRAAVAAGTNITYKILFNDAVAMTGGQGNDGGLSAARIAREVLAMGIETVALVYDDKEELDLSAFPKDISKDDRTQLLSVQKRLSETEGVSVLIYVQTCAAEKRRRRKRGKFPDPNKRIFINSDVCEGCGDCGVQSNCVAIAPLETAFGRKRMIDQSACNKDFSCVSGFCPSFVTLEGATPRKAATTALDLPEMPLPSLAPIEGTWNVVVTGIGGTGVVTLGAVIAQAAQLDGKGAGMMEMAGLAQKGGAVHIHCRLAEKPADISAIRVATGECDVLIGGDLVVSAGAKTLGLTQSGRTGAVVNSHEAVSGEFTRDTEFQIPHDRLSLSLEARLQERLDLFDASALAKTLMGDSIFSNMMVLGGAWQRGYLPLSHDALKAAIELNGAAVEKNLYAFELGRWAVLHLSEAQKLLAPSLIKLPQTLDEKIAIRADHLKAYQGRRLRKRYLALVSKIENPELKELVAKAYHKLLAYKDEYEVARLHRLTRAKAAEQFENIDQITYHLAPPLLSKLGPDGRPLKRQFGAWIEKAFGVLARIKFLRGTPFDVFGYSDERRMERELIKQYEADLAAFAFSGGPVDTAALQELAELPLQIRGFGPVKFSNYEKAEKRRLELLDVLRNSPPTFTQAAE